MEEQVKVETRLAVGSLVFDKFEELYQNIKGRTSGFSSMCTVLHGGKAVVSFPIKFEKNGMGKERFVLELNSMEMNAVKSLPQEIKTALKKVLPGFQKVGCSAEGFMDGQKYFGYVPVNVVRFRKMSA